MSKKVDWAEFRKWFDKGASFPNIARKIGWSESGLRTKIKEEFDLKPCEFLASWGRPISGSTKKLMENHYKYKIKKMSHDLT